MHTGCVVGACVCAPGCACRFCGSMAICDPRGSFVLGVLGVCTHVVQMCVICIVYTFAVYGSVWGICSCFGGMYTCVGVVFFIEVQMLAGKHHLICGPQRPVPGLVASESPGTLLKINSLRAHLDRFNLQEQGLGIWILTCATSSLILMQSPV